MTLPAWADRVPQPRIKSRRTCLATAGTVLLRRRHRPARLGSASWAETILAPGNGSTQTGECDSAVTSIITLNKPPTRFESCSLYTNDFPARIFGVTRILSGNTTESDRGDG